MSADPFRVLLPHHISGNIYVQQLGNAYMSSGCEVWYGLDNFYESNLLPDILHLNWPEDLYRGNRFAPVNEQGSRLVNKLSEWKSNGVKIVWTVHNLTPHEPINIEEERGIFQKIFDLADIVHHHCDQSLAEAAKIYDGTEKPVNVVVPHGHFFGYKNEISRSQARKELGIQNDEFTFLHFGAIRGYKGLENVIRAFRVAKIKNSKLLIAGRLKGISGLKRRIQVARYRYAARGLQCHFGTVENDDIQKYVNASDALVLGHAAGLNSGVAILGMSFGKIVIGPNLGCIGDVLARGTNIVYPPGSIAELANGMRKAKYIDADSAKQANLKAANAWRWRDIVSAVIEKKQ